MVEDTKLDIKLYIIIKKIKHFFHNLLDYSTSPIIFERYITN